jgi:soluble lytic murein transglycosylase-like protein
LTREFIGEQIGQVFANNSVSRVEAKNNKRRSIAASSLSFLRRFAPLILLVFVALVFVALYFINDYWIHRFDSIIERQAAIYRLEPQFVWSLIHEETYFRTEEIGDAGEVGLMQITPGVAREWAKETGIA